LRLGSTLAYAQGPWSAKLGADWHAAQNRVPTGSVATGAYTLLNASVSYRQRLDATVLHWFVRLDNLTDQLAYSATSILTSTAFGKSPLPGRSLKLGVQASF
jgi:iron complex outermembrane receptor protein